MASYQRCWRDNRRVSQLRKTKNVGCNTDKRKEDNQPIPVNFQCPNRFVVLHVEPFYRTVKSASHIQGFKDITNCEANFPFSQLSSLHCSNLLYHLL